MSKAIFTIGMFFMLSASPLLGQIIEDANIVVDNDFPPQPGGVELSVFQSPDSGVNVDPTSVFGEIEIVGQNATLNFTDIALDEGSDWFATSFCDAFTRETIDSGQFDTLVDFVGADFVFNSLTVGVDQSFFLGVNTGQDGGVSNRQHFGWGEFLINQDADLVVLDSAVAYDSGGIFIGKNSAIPEPSSGLLILAGISLLSVSRNRRGK
jgi:hypothetical protein